MHWTIIKGLLFITFLSFQTKDLWAQAILFEYDGPDTIFVNEVGCNAILEWGHPDNPTVSSNLDGGVIDTFYILSISDGYQIGSQVNYKETVVIDYWAEDNFGNVDIFSFSIYFGDNIDPTFIQDPMDLNVACDSDVDTKLLDWYNANGNSVMDDGCGVPICIKTPSLDSVIANFASSMDSLCGNTGQVDVEFTVQDEEGNVSETVLATFRSVDVLKPTIVFSASNLMVNCDQTTPAVIENWIDNVGNATAVDNCTDSLDWYLFIWSDSEGNDGTGIPGVGPYPNGYLSSCNWFVNVSFFVRDECNNNRATTGTFSTSDMIAPILLSFPADITVDCSQIPDGSSVMASDECLGLFVPEIIDLSDQNGEFNDCAYYNYTIERTFLATDACGLSASHVQVISVIDTIGPLFYAPADITIECYQETSATVTGVPTDIYDACNSPFFISFQDSESGDACEEIILREWTITDACGNESSDVQMITRADMEAPFINILPMDISVHCMDEASIRDAFETWVNNKGGATASDNCSLVNSFVASPESYDIDNPFTFPGSLPSSVDFIDCLSSMDHQVRFVELNFVFYDDCGNGVESMASFSVIDTIAPIFSYCPPDETSYVSASNCELLYSIDYPEAFDDCSIQGSPYQYLKSAAIISSIPGDPTSPVDTVKFSIGPITGIVEANAMPDVLIEFSNVDMDDSLEYFMVYGEDDMLLGITPYTSQQCSDTFLIVQNITNALLLDWLSDQYIELTLIPYTEDGIGNFAINDVCGFSFANLSFALDMVEEYSLHYEVSLNGGEKEGIDFINPNEYVLGAGSHDLNYYVFDCAGNMDSCTTKITVIDTIAPIVFCPSNQQLVLSAGNCSAEYLIEPPTGYTDNCGPQSVFEQQDPSSGFGFISFYFVPSFNGYIAGSSSYIFEDVGANALTDNPILKLEYLLDGDESDEYFFITGEDGTILGTTQIGSPNVIPSDCDKTGSAEVIIPSGLFNAWASDGELEITIVPNLDYGLDFGINPCNPLAVTMDGDSDGKSYVNMNLSYGQSFPSFYINGATVIPPTELSGPSYTAEVDLYGGLNNIHYIFSDASGNKDTCNHEMDVIDLEYPTAICQEVVLFADPSGVTDIVLNPFDVDNGSFDNCDIDTMFVVPDTFNCTQIDSQFTVLFYVTDLSGNSSSCETIVRIESVVLEPQYSASICGADTLLLFANVELPYPDFQYTYSWTGPNSFVSSEENPIIPNAGVEYSGTFVLIVEGFNGCTASGTVEVFIQELGTPELIISENQFCIGDDVLLETEGYTGNVSYEWYEGIYPNGQLMGTTMVPSFIVSPSLGEHLYYLIVEGVNCTSNPSGSKSVEVFSYPGVSVCDAFLTLCEGETISLCSNETGTDYSYHWTGPNGYEAMGQQPPSIENISAIHAGTYSLVIDNGVCFSDTAITQITILEKPPVPIITGSNQYCEGSAIILTVSNITNGDLYFWNQDGVSWPPQSSNSLLIPNANVSHSGNWSVAVQKGLCNSDTSEVFNVSVESALNIIANNDGPACQGDSVQLTTAGIPGATYYWEGPNNYESEMNSPFIEAQEGTYNLTVTTNSGCENTANTFVEIAPAPTITAISSNATNCMDGMTDVTFFPTVWPLDNIYTYDWTGPGFEADDEFPVIENFTSSMNGQYILQVSNNNCNSEPDTITINIKDTPEPSTIIEYPAVVCEGDSIILISNSYPLGTEYNWVTPAGNKKTFVNTFIDPNASINDGGIYTLSVELNGCNSIISAEISIEVKELPDPVQSDGSATVCAGDTIFLFSEFVAGAIYEWIGPNFNAEEQNPIIENAASANQGWYQVRITVDECPSDWSAPVIINVIELTEILQAESIDTAICLDAEMAMIELCVSENTEIPGSIYNWYNAEDDALLVSSSDLCVLLTDLSMFSEGIGEIYVIASVSGCTTAPSDLLQFEFYEIPAIQANAGPDVYNCVDDPVQLNASVEANLNGIWSFEGGHQVSSIDDPNAFVSLDGTGFYEFVWTISNGACKDFSIDTVLVYQPQDQTATPDSFIMNEGETINLNIFENDLVGENFVFNVLDEVFWGDLEVGAGNIISYMADENFVGIVQFSYEVCDPYCPDLCKKTTVLIQIGDVDGCVPYNLITPNKDGINDHFYFPCLELDDLSTSELLIFNQWGDEIYSSSPYLNNWDATYNGEKVAAGTYYYIFKSASDADAVYGFIIIEY